VLVGWAAVGAGVGGGGGGVGGGGGGGLVVSLYDTHEAEPLGRN